MLEVMCQLLLIILDHGLKGQNESFKKFDLNASKGKKHLHPKMHLLAITFTGFA